MANWQRGLALGVSLWCCSWGLLSVAQDVTPEAKAMMLQQASEGAQMRLTGAQKSFEELTAKAKPFRDTIATAKQEEVKATAAIQAAEKELPAKVEVAKKAEADKPAIDKAAADATAAAVAATHVKDVLTKLNTDLAGAAKSTADIAVQSQTTLEKMPTDAALTQIKASADKIAADTDALSKAVTARLAEADKAATDLAAIAKTETEKATAHAKLLADSQAAVKALEEAIATNKANLVQYAETIKNNDVALMGLQPELDKAAALVATVTLESIDAQQKHQHALSDIGQFVVFSSQVAPIFAKRCTACHNARIAKGRYNMDTYAAIMKGGEQGDTIIPTDGELSNLCVMIDNGSMPKDADPLKKEEIDLIKKWVTLGAVLDAGKDPNAQLSAIMPKFPQPAPPETYRVPVSITGLAFSPDGTQVASSGYHEVVLWNPNDAAQIRRITNVAERTYEIQYSPDGRLLAVAAGTPGQMGEVKLFNAADGTLLMDLVNSSDSIFAVSFSPDGKRLAAAGADRAIRVFSVETGKQELLIEDHADWVMGIAWSADGAKLASASRDKTSKVFDAKTGESLVTFPGHGEPVFGVAFLPNGTEIATAGRDKNIRIWNAANAQQVRAIGGFGNEVFRVIVTPDGRVFSCSADMTAREHKLDGTAVRTFTGHKDWVYSLAFNPVTKKLATGSWEGEVRIWNAEDAQQLVEFVAAPGFKPVTTTAAAQ